MQPAHLGGGAHHMHVQVTNHEKWWPMKSQSHVVHVSSSLCNQLLSQLRHLLDDRQLVHGQCSSVPYVFTWCHKIVMCGDRATINETDIVRVFVDYVR